MQSHLWPPAFVYCSTLSVHWVFSDRAKGVICHLHYCLTLQGLHMYFKCPVNLDKSSYYTNMLSDIFPLSLTRSVGRFCERLGAEKNWSTMLDWRDLSRRSIPPNTDPETVEQSIQSSSVEHSSLCMLSYDGVYKAHVMPDLKGWLSLDKSLKLELSDPIEWYLSTQWLRKATVSYTVFCPEWTDQGKELCPNLG